MREIIYKSCGCGAEYTKTQWQELPVLGYQDLGDGTEVDVRNCLCHSTLYGPRAWRIRSRREHRGPYRASELGSMANNPELMAILRSAGVVVDG
jgi:hypothetical protein